MRLELQGFHHCGNDVGLGDGLAEADGQRVIAISIGRIGSADERFARNRPHGSQHTLILNPTGAQLLCDHEGALLSETVGIAKAIAEGWVRHLRVRFYAMQRRLPRAQVRNLGFIPGPCALLY